MSHSALSRAVKYVNIAIAVLAAAVLILLYWYAWRSLPQHSGTIAAPVGARATVSFDGLGEPHIHAASLDDALFAQGYLVAQDRLWQMDALRRFSAGELAEVLGPALVETDREARSLRMRRIAEDAYTTLPAGDRAAFAAYARGVNFFISTHLDNLPLEFTLLHYQPRPWSAIDSLLICLHMFRNLTTTWRDEIIKRNLLEGGDAEKVNFLYPARLGIEPTPGSNAWAVAGSRTASGKPILSNDPHLEYSLPGIWWMAHLEAPGIDAAGVTVPGLPGIVIGHNERIAWGITNLQFDVQDLYIEKFDDRTGRYQYGGQWEQAAIERELIRVKGQKPLEINIPVTRHGPLIVTDGGMRMSLRWTAAVHGVLQYPFVDIDRAQNWQQFTAALRRFPGPGSNFVYADTDGNIGYHAAGVLPKRKGYLGDLPVDGSSPNYDWDGFISFDELPSVFNPPSGIIETSNQNPFPTNYPYPVHGNFAPPDRARQARALLSARTGWRPQEMLTVQKDVYSAFQKFVAGEAVAAYDRRHTQNASLDDAVTLLRNWNGQMEKDLAAPLLATLIFQHVRTAMVEQASPGKSTLYEAPVSYAVVEKLLRERPDGWFRDYDDMLLRSLVDAVEEGRRMQGRDPKKWRYGAWLNLKITHPIFDKIPWAGKYLDIGPVPMSGSTTTVKQTTLKLAPSMRLNVDLGNLDGSLLNLQVGQSGQAFSSHYKDQWPDYYVGRSYPMQFRNVKAKSTLEFRPQ